MLVVKDREGGDQCSLLVVCCSLSLGRCLLLTSQPPPPPLSPSRLALCDDGCTTATRDCIELWYLRIPNDLFIIARCTRPTIGDDRQPTTTTPPPTPPAPSVSSSDSLPHSPQLDEYSEAQATIPQDWIELCVRCLARWMVHFFCSSMITDE